MAHESTYSSMAASLGLAELSCKAVLNVQGLGIAVSSLLLQSFYLYMISQLHLKHCTLLMQTDQLFHAVVMVNCFVFLR